MQINNIQLANNILELKKGKYNPIMVGDKFYPKRKVKVGGVNQKYYGDKISNKNNEYIKEEGHYGT